MEKELFENNKIVEALCKISFEPQSDVIFEQFEAALKAGGTYINKEDLKAISFLAVNGQPNVTSSQIPYVNFYNSSKDKIIQLYNNSISIHQINKYKSWELFSGDIYKVLDSFNELSKPLINRIDLKSVNVFNFPYDDDFKLQEYFNIYSMQPETMKISSLNISMEYPLGNNNLIVLKLGVGVQETNITIVLDLNFINLSEKRSFNKDEVIGIIEKGHSSLYELFCSLITKKTKEIIK